MTRRESIEKAFKELLKGTPYGKISVKDICEASGVSRSAFYAEFSDKEAIVESLFIKHALSSQDNINKMLSLSDLKAIDTSVLQMLYEGIYKEKEYYINLVGSAFSNDNTFVRVATKCIVKHNEEILPRIGLIDTDWKAEYTNYFFAASQAMFLQKWIMDKLRIPPREIAQLYYQITSAYYYGLSQREESQN